MLWAFFIAIWAKSAAIAVKTTCIPKELLSKELVISSKSPKVLITDWIASLSVNVETNFSTATFTLLILASKPSR